MVIREVEEKKNSQNKAKARSRRKKRTALAVIITLLILTLICGVLMFTVLFPIANITVEGNSLYSSEQIIAAAQVNKGDKLFSVFTEPVNSRVTKALPYVKSIKLEKHLPDTLELKITEAKETFAFASGESYFVADGDFKILRDAAEIPENTAEIKIPGKLEFVCGYTLPSSDSSLELVKKTYDALEKEEMTVNSIEISEYGYITAKISGRFTVYFGTEDDLEGKLSHLKGMIAEIDKKNGTSCKG
ncbi:MAG: FtsQ-type POTRA domain-containing protein, partial [Clostridiales bacterium]|nr:FtsQ-type POTRA domain-containing protein [Candidatus Equinaster intestinalis]